MSNKIPHLGDFSLENWILLPKADQSLTLWLSDNDRATLIEFLKNNSYIFEFWERSLLADKAMYNAPELREEVLRFLQIGGTIKHVKTDIWLIMNSHTEALVGNWSYGKIVVRDTAALKVVYKQQLWEAFREAGKASIK
jgi:hypothetical protein